MACVASAASCKPASEARPGCAGAASLVGSVFWPGLVEPIAPGDHDARARALERAGELASRSADRTATRELVGLAAAVGHTTFAVETARALGRRRAVDRDLEAASLLARHEESGSVEDLLDAAEILVAESSPPVASRCNRLVVLRRLGLGYRAAARRAECPCTELVRDPDPVRSFPLDGRRHSADRLDPGEPQRVDRLLAQGGAGARTVFRRAGQAWRVWFEREALEPWLDARDAAQRRLVEDRTLRLARAYGDATGNGVPFNFWLELSNVESRAMAGVRAGLVRWREGREALAGYEPERVESALPAARSALAARVPSLLPAIDLAQATARYYLGDDSGMLARAMDVRRRVPLRAAPWAWARAYWLEAAALQGRADWAEAMRRAEEAGRLYEAIAEPANAGFQDQIVALSLESQGDPRAAARDYLQSVRRVESAGDTRLLAGALTLFARQQSRAGRPSVAVELQREAVVLDTADATPQVVAEAEAVLAEQLYRAGAVEEGDRAIERARAATARIVSPQPRRRAEAILAHAHSTHLVRTDPAAAERALDRFLSDFASFGERFFRAEALILRARARLLRRDLPGAERDLAEALEEIASQGGRLEDRARGVALLDQAREALELLVGVVLARPQGETRALAWIESLRREQIGRGFGVATVDPRRRGSFPAAPEGRCITEYWSTSAELLSWTSCNTEPPRLVRVPVSRDELWRALDDLHEAARSGELGEIRRRSAAASRWLVAPLRNLLGASVSWTVIPDAGFPAVPLAWLSFEDRFLFETRMVKLAPTWPEQGSERAPGPRAWRALAIGDPSPAAETSRPRLPHARDETEQLARLFPGSSARVGEAATWSSLLEARAGFDLLHIATHTSSGSVVPLSARLELAPEPSRPDGRVSADEVARADLRNLALAVVASCSSAAATHRGIGGGLDFARAFLSAGAEDVVGTLWDVPDADVSAVIAELYDELRDGSEPAEALRKVWLNGLADPARGDRVHVRAALQMSSANP